MHKEANLHLTDAEVAGIRNVGGIAYMGIVFGQGARGAKYRPIRTGVHRTEEGAQRELNAFRLKRGVLITRREVVLVEAKKEQIV